MGGRTERLIGVIGRDRTIVGGDQPERRAQRVREKGGGGCTRAPGEVLAPKDKGIRNALDRTVMLFGAALEVCRDRGAVVRGLRATQLQSLAVISRTASATPASLWVDAVVEPAVGSHSRSRRCRNRT